MNTTSTDGLAIAISLIDDLIRDNDMKSEKAKVGSQEFNYLANARMSYVQTKTALRMLFQTSAAPAPSAVGAVATDDDDPAVWGKLGEKLRTKHVADQPTPAVAEPKRVAKLSAAQRRALNIVARGVWVLNTNGAFYHSHTGMVADKHSEIAVGKTRETGVAIATINKLCELGLLVQERDNHQMDSGRGSFWRTYNCYAITPDGEAALAR